MQYCDRCIREVLDEPETGAADRIDVVPDGGGSAGASEGAVDGEDVPEPGAGEVGGDVDEAGTELPIDLEGVASEPGETGKEPYNRVGPEDFIPDFGGRDEEVPGVD